MGGRGGIERIKSLDRAGLLELWARIRSRRTGGVPQGKAFEHLVLQAFRLEGAQVQWPYEVQLEDNTVEQIDGALYIDGLAFLVESKDHSEPVGFEPIAKLKAQLTRRPPFVMGIVFSSTQFTVPARSLARHLPPPSVLLWASEELQRGLEQGQMREELWIKLRCAVEQGRPDHFPKEGAR